MKIPALGRAIVAIAVLSVAAPALGAQGRRGQAPPGQPPGITPAPLKADVDVTELMGNEIFLYLLTGKKQFIARVDPRTHARAGEQIDLIVNMDNMHIFDPQTEKMLDAPK